jgi:5-deoxy-D-glucuronate isomerase
MRPIHSVYQGRKESEMTDVPERIMVPLTGKATVEVESEVPIWERRG